MSDVVVLRGIATTLDASLPRLVQAVRKASLRDRSNAFLWASPTWKAVLLTSRGHVAFVPGVVGAQAANQWIGLDPLLHIPRVHDGLPRQLRSVLTRPPIVGPLVEPGMRYARAATGGCFDGLHDGHRSFLLQCQALAASLTVYLNTDRSVQGLKGAGRPLLHLEDRLQAISPLLRPSDDVGVFTARNGGAELTKGRFAIFFKGVDYWLHNIPEALQAKPAIPTLIVDSVIEMHTSELKEASQRTLSW
jgi:cytidyltransferase-like protein